jgi:glyoxylase-like metal-dependent hydrolase (beta-lactamase superfamily II)
MVVASVAAWRSQAVRELRGHLVDGLPDWRRHPAAGREPPALDPVELQALGQPSEAAAQLDRLGDAEVVRRGAKQRGRQGACASVEAMDRSRRGARADGVNEDHLALALPRIEQARRLAPALDRLHSCGVQAPGDLEAGRVVAAPVVALHDGDSIDLGAVTVRAIALPGHTTDMTGLLIADRALIGGDSLFADGIARPDLQRGDAEGARAMGRTLHDRVLTLGDDVVLLPGHTHPAVSAAAIAPALGRVRAAVGELSVAQITEQLGTSQQNASRHLGVLLQAGIVARRKAGTSSYYSVTDHGVYTLCEQVCGGLLQQLVELQSLVESTR